MINPPPGEHVGTQSDLGNPRPADESLPGSRESVSPAPPLPETQFPPLPGSVPPLPHLVGAERPVPATKETSLLQFLAGLFVFPATFLAAFVTSNNFAVGAEAVLGGFLSFILPLLGLALGAVAAYAAAKFVRGLLRKAGL